MPSWRWLAILASFLTLVGSVIPGLAAEDLKIKRVSIAIWPEYDDPRVLVQYSGEFSGGPFPQRVQLYVPKGVAINSACAVNPDGQHTSEVWEMKDTGDGYALVTYNLPIPTFHLEFYYDPLEGTPDKSMTYLFKAPYAIESLQLEVQQPLKAGNFSVTPPTTSIGTDAQGFQYYNYSYSDLERDRVIELKIAYTKSDPNPSVKRQGAASTKGSPSGGAASDMNWGMVILLIGGALLLGVAAYWVVDQRSRRDYGPQRYSPPPMKSARKGSADRAAPAGGFCANCGQALEAGDRFCPRCGTRARRRA